MPESDLEAYRAAVELYAKDGTNYLFHNKGDIHALIILTNIFKNAEQKIRIVANMLFNDEVVNTKEYVESMKSFLDKKDTQLEIIISIKPSKEEVKRHGKENTLYWMIFNHPAYRQNRVQIKESSDFVTYKNEKEIKELNFCTGDDRMYRLETNTIERKAVANFQDQTITKLLVRVFDTVFDRISSTVDLSEYYCY